ncbi:hypothetical protein [Streptosporangium pseudovulgare]|nr:hypothetical protein [Streptosporangium pseudovulgare]
MTGVNLADRGVAGDGMTGADPADRGVTGVNRAGDGMTEKNRENGVTAWR